MNPATSTIYKLARQSGVALLAIFIVTVIAGSLPLTPQNPEWGIRLSNLVVSAASLPLIGLLLLRASSHQALMAVPEEVDLDYARKFLKQGAQAEPLKHRSKSLQGAVRALRGQMKIARVALGLAIAMALIVLVQFVLWFTSFNLVERQGLQRLAQIEQRQQTIRSSIQNATPEALNQLNRNQAAVVPAAGSPDAATARQPISKDILLKRLDGEQEGLRKQSIEQTDRIKFAVSKDLARNIMVALIFGWAFYGLSKT